MPVEIYKSTDASAPVLTGEPGKLVDLLDAVLVNGYGSKAAAGWTKPYTGTASVPWHQTSGGGTGSSASSHTVSGIVSSPGTTIFLAVIHSDVAGVVTASAPTGWTALVTNERFGQDGSDAAFNLYYRHIRTSADTSPITATVNFSASAIAVSAFATFSNVDFADPYVLEDPGTPVAAGLTADSPAITVDTDNDVILAICAVHDDISLTIPSGFTGSGSGSYAAGDMDIAMAYRAGNAAGLQGPFTWTKSANNGLTSYTVTVAIKGATNSKSAAFRQGAGNLRYLQVIDGGAASFLTQEASLKIAEAMTSAISGTNLTPSTSIGIRKSWTSDNTARPWVIVADEKRFYIFVQTGDVASSWFGGFVGDFESFISGDTYNTIIFMRTPGSGATGNEGIGFMVPLGSGTNGLTYVLRNYLGTGSGLTVKRVSDVINFVVNSTSSLGGIGAAGTLAYPNPQNGALYIADSYIHEDHSVQTAANVFRGRLPGMWFPLHGTANFDDLSVYTGEGVHTGKQFIFLKNVYSSSGQGNIHGVMLEYSDTWE